MNNIESGLCNMLVK